jgi:hypothetical protein
MLRDWTRLLRFDQWEAVLLLAWIGLITLLTFVLIYKLLQRDWIRKRAIRNRLLFLSFVSLLALGAIIPLNFGPFDYIAYMLLVGFQTCFMNMIIYTQIDMLSLFAPISGISGKVIKSLKIVLIVLFIFTIPVFIGGMLLHVYASGKSPKRARWIGFIIVPNVAFCWFFELWVEFYSAYILHRYLKNQSNQTPAQRKDFRRLQYWTILMAVHDVFSAVMFFMSADALRFARAAISVHFLLVAQMFHMMLRVTFPKKMQEPSDNQTTIPPQSRLAMHPIPAIEIRPGGATRMVSFGEHDTRVPGLDGFSSDQHAMDTPRKSLIIPPVYEHVSSIGVANRLEVGLNLDTPTTSQLLHNIPNKDF